MVLCLLPIHRLIASGSFCKAIDAQRISASTSRYRGEYSPRRLSFSEKDESVAVTLDWRHSHTGLRIFDHLGFLLSVWILQVVKESSEWFVLQQFQSQFSSSRQNAKQCCELKHFRARSTLSSIEHGLQQWEHGLKMDILIRKASQSK